MIKNGKLQHKGVGGKDDDKYEYYTSEDEHGHRIQKMRKKGTKKRDASKEPKTEKPRGRRNERSTARAATVD